MSDKHSFGSTENPTTDTPAVSHETQAQEIIKSYMLMTSGAGLVPLPLLDIVLVSSIQLKMLQALATLYDQAFDKELGKSMIGALLGSALPMSAAGSFAKLLPGLGTVSGMISMSILSSAATYALGQVFVKHFASGGSLLTLDVEAVRGQFLDSLEEGKKAAARLRKTMDKSQD